MFYFEKINGKKVLKSDLLNEAEHFFTTKESFIKTKEEEFFDTVEKNTNNIKKYLKTDILISPRQTHGDNIAFVGNKRLYPNTDALILKRTDCAIFLNFADCTPVILYDKRNNTGAIAHAGWRGTALQIALKTLKKMGSNPKDVTALIGPCICFKCFETSDEAISLLKNTLNDTKDLFLGNYADLKGINARMLEQEGVENIDICPYCTCCDNDLFFSYRKENKTTNRISAVLKLNP